MAPPSRAYDPVLERAFTRITGGDVHGGNAVRLLKDADENYPAWLEAIRSARTSLLFEDYIVDEDDTGRRFADALAEHARRGVRVCVLYDWFGRLRRASAGFWAELARAGVEVRAFNPPSLASPLARVRRNHRKALAVDGRVAFVSGLCVSEVWLGDPARGVGPWHDTRIELRGPAVADVVRAFAETWVLAGPALPDADRPGPRGGAGGRRLGRRRCCWCWPGDSTCRASSSAGRRPPGPAGCRAVIDGVEPRPRRGGWLATPRERLPRGGSRGGPRAAPREGVARTRTPL